MSVWEWRKTLARLLLLLAAADLVWPGACRTDGGILFAVQNFAATGSAPTESGGQPGRYYEDDCFCCCSHIFTAPRF